MQSEVLAGVWPVVIGLKALHHKEAARDGEFRVFLCTCVGITAHQAHRQSRTYLYVYKQIESSSNLKEESNETLLNEIY